MKSQQNRIELVTRPALNFPDGRRWDPGLAVPGQRFDPVVCDSGADGFPGAGLQVQMLLPHQWMAYSLIFPTTLPILIPILLRGHQGKSEI